MKPVKIEWLPECADDQPGLPINEGLRDLVQSTTYKPGYSFELKLFTGDTYSLRLFTPIIPRDQEGEETLAVAKILPRSAMDHLDRKGVVDVLLGLAFWWETHELAEWFHVDGKAVLDVRGDHTGYMHTDAQVYSDLDMLRQWGHLLRTRRFP